MATPAAVAFNREIFTELGVGFLIVSLRTYARWSSVGFSRFMLDDYLMGVAIVSPSPRLKGFLREGSNWICTISCCTTGYLWDGDLGCILGWRGVSWVGEQQHDG